MIKRIFLALCLVLASSAVFAEGLSTLIEVGRSMGDIAKEREAEIRSFEAVKRAIQNGSLKKGLSKDSVRRQYGEPVIELEESGGAKVKWVYKHADSSFFEGNKAYLVFDSNGCLEDAQFVEPIKSAGSEEEAKKK